MTDTTRTVAEAPSNTKATAAVVWSWLTRHPVALATLFFVLGFVIG